MNFNLPLSGIRGAREGKRRGREKKGAKMQHGVPVENRQLSDQELTKIISINSSRITLDRASSTWEYQNYAPLAHSTASSDPTRTSSYRIVLLLRLFLL